MADETNSPRAPSTSTGVTVGDMQDYLAIDGDDDVLKSLIGYAEEDARGSIDSTIDIEIYRKLPIFNQAVRTLVDFNSIIVVLYLVNKLLILSLISTC